MDMNDEVVEDGWLRLVFVVREELQEVVVT